MFNLITREPVRLYLYGVLLAVLAVLVGYGTLTGEQAALWAALGAAVLGVPVTELLRGRVVPVPRAQELVDATARTGLAPNVAATRVSEDPYSPARRE